MLIFKLNIKELLFADVEAVTELINDYNKLIESLSDSEVIEIYISRFVIKN